MVPQSKSRRRLNNKCLSFVRASLGLKSKSNRAFKDVIFIAIDTEGTKDNLTELGISTLDSRDIKGLDHGPSALEWTKQIKPQHFRFKAGQRYPFLFGAVEHRVPVKVVQPYLKLRSDRMYVLVGHDLKHDIEKLSHVLGHELRNEPNIVAIVDTYMLAQESREMLPGRLSELWRFLVMHGSGNVLPGDVVKLFSPKQQTGDLNSASCHAFHNAGNDAFYNMHTLLLLALYPDLLKEPKEGSSLSGVFLAARSKASRLVRRLADFSAGSQVQSSKNVPAAGSFIRRPEGVASVQPRQSSNPKQITLRIKNPKT